MKYRKISNRALIKIIWNYQNNKIMYRVYFENKESTMGGYEDVGFFKLMWWMFLGSIKPKEKSDIYYIRKIEMNGTRI